MPSHREHKILPYTPQQMYDLVLDIESYPEFLPWCAGARINQRGNEFLLADVMVGYKMLREKFSSRVEFVPDQSIHVKYLNGPMRHLQNDWHFASAAAGQCQVDFSIDFEFSSPLLQILIEKFFNEALKRMISAFEQRARIIYS